MKRLILTFLTPIIFSCGEKPAENSESRNVLENLTFTIDTVVVDAGEDMFVVTYGLGNHHLSSDKSLLYFFESDPLNFVEVDLDKLKLLKKTEFQREGPDGIGSSLVGFTVGPEQKMMINGYSSISLFHQEGKKVQDLKFVPAGIDTQLARNSPSLYSSVVYDFENGKLYTQPSFESAGEYGLYVLDPVTKTAKSLPIPKMKIVDDYSGDLTIRSGEGVSRYYFSAPKFTTHLPGELILSTTAMSGVYRYDAQLDSVHFFDIQHKTVPNAMDMAINKNAPDMAGIEEIRRKMEEHINYLQVHWDETREMYLRMGKKTFKGQTKEDPTKFELFLFAYDKEFNVLGENRLNGLNANVYSYFLKDGKLWSYVNVEDELGFAVFSFNF
jgi:hypothetical protein